MKLNLRELELIERLLTNRMNADFDPNVAELLHKVRVEMNKMKRKSNMPLQNGTFNP